MFGGEASDLKKLGPVISPSMEPWPRKFLIPHGQAIPSDLILELPNGYEHLVHLNHEEKALYNFSDIFKKNNISLPATIQFIYDNGGKLKIFIMNENGTEIKYPTTAKSLSDRLYRQDERNAAGWKFLVITTPSTMQTGEIVKLIRSISNRMHRCSVHNLFQL